MADRQRYVAVTRFTVDATPEVKREFAVALVAALEAIQIPQGEEFLVVDPEFLDELRDDIDEARAEADHNQLQMKDALDTIKRAREIVKDFELGIRDRAEVIELIRDLDVEYT